MSEQINIASPETERDDTQAPWLEQARRQAHTAAEIRSQADKPFQWDAVDRQESGGWLGLFGPSTGRLRLSWALPALALVVLGGGTGTLAYVHLRADRAPGTDAVMLDQATHPAGPGKVRVEQPVKLDQYLKAPAPAPKKRTRPAETRRPVRTRPAKKARRPVMASKKAVHTTKPAAKRATDKGNIIFGHTDMPGGGEVIIVRPPSKLGPLFRTKDFKKGGPYGSRR